MIAGVRRFGDGWRYSVLDEMDISTPHVCCIGHEPHETPYEAKMCAETWLRDPSAVDLGWWYASERPCLECQAPTSRGARIRGVGRNRTVPLCEEHMKAEVAVRFANFAQVVVFP